MSIYYTKDHEWIKPEDGKLRIGITAYAQDRLGDIVFVGLPKMGESLLKEDVLVVVESVKAVGEVLAPVDGEVVEVNERLNDQPELINESPANEGWLACLSPKEEIKKEQWMSEADYLEFIEGLK